MITDSVNLKKDIMNKLNLYHIYGEYQESEQRYIGLKTWY